MSKLRWSFLVALYFCFAPLLHADCDAPHYRVCKTYDYTAPTVLLDISIPLQDFTPDKLVCLATVLKQRYRGPEVAVGIFSSHKAAVNYTIASVEAKPNENLWASQQHAQYYYNAGKLEDYVLMIPDGLSLRFGPTTTITRIDLPVKGKPSPLTPGRAIRASAIASAMTIATRGSIGVSVAGNVTGDCITMPTVSCRWIAIQ